MTSSASEPDAEELRHALGASRSEGNYRLAVMRAVLSSELVVPLAALSAPGRAAEVMKAADEHGNVVLPAFTELAGVAEFAGPEGGFGLLTGLEGARLARDMSLSGLVIDPVRPWAFVLSAQEMGMLADGIAPTGEGQGRVYADRFVHPLGTAASDRLLSAAASIASRRGVERVYLYEARYGSPVSAGVPSLGLVLSPRKREGAMRS